MGSVGNVCKRLEGLDTVGNAQVGSGEETVGSLGEISTAGIWGRYHTSGS